MRDLQEELELNKKISENICKYMALRNVTQKELAEALHVSQASVSNWTKGIKIPRMPKLDMICSYLNIKRSDLFGIETNSNLPSAEFTDQDAEVLELFNKLEQEDKEMVLAMMRRMVK